MTKDKQPTAPSGMPQMVDQHGKPVQMRQLSGQEYVQHLARQAEILRLSYDQVIQQNADLRIEANRQSLRVNELQGAVEVSASLLAAAEKKVIELQPPNPAGDGKPPEN